MSVVNPRASGLWSSSRMSYMSVAESHDEGDEEVDIEGLGFEAPDDFDGRTPLDKTIDRIGMGECIVPVLARSTSHLQYEGSYQWTLLCLCGFGEYASIHPS